MPKILFTADIVLTIPRIKANEFPEALTKVNSFLNNPAVAPLKPMITEVTVNSYEEEEEPTQ